MKKGEIIERFVCDDCARRSGFTPKRPADSGRQSWYCHSCQHHNIGSTMVCEVGDWLTVIPKGHLQSELLDDQS